MYPAAWPRDVGSSIHRRVPDRCPRRESAAKRPLTGAIEGLPPRSAGRGLFLFGGLMTVAPLAGRDPDPPSYRLLAGNLRASPLEAA